MDRNLSEGKTVPESARIIAMASGKGGVGKTVLSASMAAGLALMNRRTIAVDADFSGPNLHKVLGLKGFENECIRFGDDGKSHLREYLVDHPAMDHLSFIISHDGILATANLPFYQRMRFIRQLMECDADYIVVDLGAGNTYNVLDLFLAADRGIVVVNPEPLSVLDGYHFLKNVLYRKLLVTFKIDSEVCGKLRAAESADHHKVPSVIESLIAELNVSHPSAGSLMKKITDDFHPSLIINACKNSDDEIKGLGIIDACKKMLSIHVSYMGSIQNDKAVDDSVENGVPFVISDPKSPASRDLLEIIQKRLLDWNKLESISAGRAIQRHVREQEKNGNDSICAYDCQYWDICEFKHGGYPCIVRKL